MSEISLWAVFGLVHLGHHGASDAIWAAMAMHNTVEKIMHVRPLWGKETSEIGIGINTGKAILASLGCDERMDYTALGESLKIAAQLERVARGGGIIIGEETYRQTQGQFPL
jgi:adenylate cyclase